MTAKMVLQQQADDFAKIKELLKFADPKKIAEAEAETRKQMQLNEDEQKKLDEAKAYIAKHETLKTDLESREKAVVQSEFANKKEADRLDELAKKLRAKAARLAAEAASD